jgi:outer membrane protein OmpA-like peptidoglycan-associated protein
MDIALHSEGIPRRINVICDHCLLTGYIEEKAVIDSKIVRECIKDITIPRYSQAARAGSKRDKKRRQGKEDQPSRPAGRSMGFLLILFLLLSLLAAVLVFPSLDVSGKLVSAYQSVVMSLRGTSGSAQVGGQQEGTGKPSTPAEPLLTDSADVKEPAEIAAKDIQTAKADGQPGLQGEQIRTPEKSVGENFVDGTGMLETGPSAVPELQSGLTSIEIDARIYEQQAAVEKREKKGTDENVETAAVADLGELPEAVPISVPEKAALERDYRFSGEPETMPGDAASGAGEEKVIIPFPRNSNDFSTSNLDQLIRLGLRVRDRDNVSLKISGYTDSSGSALYNDRLSLIRATMVKSYLLGLGIHPDRLDVQGLGSQNPIADNATEKGKQLNRRVEVEVIERTR